MNPTTPPYTVLIEETEKLLDQLISTQEEEQKCILQRKTDQLPGICHRINDLTTRLETKQKDLGIASRSKSTNDATDTKAKSCAEKFKHLQKLALQNHLLLENSLHFLETIFSEVLGRKKPVRVYNHQGSISPREEIGLLLHMEI